AQPSPLFEVWPNSGERRWFEANIRRGGGHMVLALIDVTRSQSINPAMEEARRARDMLLRDAGVGTWRFDPDEELYTFSPELMPDYDRAQLVVPKARVDLLCHPDD